MDAPLLLGHWLKLAACILEDLVEPLACVFSTELAFGKIVVELTPNILHYADPSLVFIAFDFSSFQLLFVLCDTLEPHGWDCVGGRCRGSQIRYSFVFLGIFS